MINIAIVEDNHNIRKGLAELINSKKSYKCIGQYETGEEFLEELVEKQVHVVLMDIKLPGMNGIDCVKQAKIIDPDLNILMLTIYEENNAVFEALSAGACGYLVKKTPPDRLIEAIKDAYEGGSPMSSHIARKVITVFQQNAVEKREINYLSDREKEVLNSLGNGNNYQEIAEELFISVDTVRHHIRNIYKKLHVHSQSEAVAKAIRKGLI